MNFLCGNTHRFSGLHRLTEEKGNENEMEERKTKRLGQKETIRRKCFTPELMSKHNTKTEATQRTIKHSDVSYSS